MALAGAAGAVVIATALSSVAPLGEARIAETSTGLAFDPLVLPLGALAIVVVVIVLGIWPAVRVARMLVPNDRWVASRRRAVALLASTGAPPSAVGVSTTPCSDEPAGRASPWEALYLERCSR